MIGCHGPQQAILRILCGRAGETEAQRQAVFFTLEGEEWKIAAQGELTQQSERWLAQIDPRQLSQALFALSTATPDHSGLAFENGWARHVHSGSGELLAIFVLLAERPFWPIGLQAARIETACRLASFAIERSNLISELSFQADHDAVTGLFNRSYYERALGYALNDPKGCALLYINLDRFRLVNDILGHGVGNRLLKEVGRRFANCLRDKDILARAGGDEFTVLLPGVSEAVAASVAGRLLRSLGQVLSVDRHELFTTASIGTTCSTAGSTPAALEREAYLAMHHAKREGRARCMRYQPSMAGTPPERLEMEQRLRFALERSEILLYYQPQIDLASGTLAGVEALMRWRPENLGIVSPAAFVPILEETGLITQFGNWVLRRACHEVKSWIDSRGAALRLAVNVSACQFAQPDFVQEVERILAETQFPPNLLELELTESVVIENLSQARGIFERLNAAGISLALDDFGTGQSSLSHLHELRFQRLKIDKVFVQAIRSGERCPPLIDNILRLGRTLGMSTVAEGIESAHQAELLQKAGCLEGQGFLYSPPLPPTEFLDTWMVQNSQFCTGK